MQYIRCIFPSSPHREYTYVDHGKVARVGSFVDVETRTGIQTVEVVGVSDSAPSLPTHVTLKSIIGLSQDIAE